MKVLSKSIIIDKNKDYNIMLEKTILSQLKSKFIVNMKCSFQDFSNLYLVLDLMKGGDLRYHLNHFEGHFPEKMIKFIIINISLCLATIHNSDIIHRDIKPENFLFDDEGYLHLTDFNSAVYREEENKKIDLVNNYQYNIYDENKARIQNISKDLVGEISYIAPEYILATENNITFSSDFYSFGVICYELIFLQKPFIEKDRYLLGQEMIDKEINFKIDFKYSEDLINLVKKLLAINPKERLGTNKGFFEIKDCEYLYDFNWEKFFDRKYESPFVEVINEYKRKFNYDKKDDMELFDYASDNMNNLDEEKIMKLNLIESNPNFLIYFQDYNYIYFEKSDLNDIINGVDNSFKVKNNKIVDNIREEIKEKNKKKNKSKSKPKKKKVIHFSHSSCSCSSCSCSCSVCNPDDYSEKSFTTYESIYFDEKKKKEKEKEKEREKYKKKKKDKKKIVYLPIIDEKKKYIIPENFPFILYDAYKYKLLKYQKLLHKIEKEEKTKKLKEDKKKEKESLSKTEKKENKRFILDKKNYYPNPFILNNNFFTPNRLFLNPSSSNPNFNNNFQNNNLNLPNIYPFYYQINQVYFPNNKSKKINYSLISSSETYDRYYRKHNESQKNKEDVSKKDIKEEKSSLKKEHKKKKKNKKQKEKKTKDKKDEKNKKKKEESKTDNNNNKSGTDGKSSSESKSEESKDDEESEEEDDENEESSDSNETKKNKLSTIKESSEEYKTSSETSKK